MLGDNIKSIRKSKNISINNLSKITSISLGYLSDLENNKAKNPTMEKLSAIASALDVSVNDFFDVTDTAPKEETLEIPKEYTDNYKVTTKDKEQYIEHMKKATESFFMNDEFDEEDKKEILDTMTEIFWKSKAINKDKRKKTTK